ncbi:MAG: hypothetical protein BGO82_08650 [Devosia sp. 67-54]|nr:MAG: hypothetical protein BGO82_08650 [Devosia sp. 67-54]
MIAACFSGCTAFIEELRGKMSEHDASSSAASSTATIPKILATGKRIDPNLPETTAPKSYTDDSYRTVTAEQHHEFVMFVRPGAAGA